MTIILIAALALTSCTQWEPSEKKWELVWEENFDGNSLDETIWSKIPRGTSDWDNYMSSYDALYAVKEGNLILRGMNNTVLPNDTAPFITGGVFSQGKKTFGLGRLEIRAKLNGAKGSWPAFWMLTDEAPYPDGGEIDIMEHLNYDNIVYQTVHSHYTINLGMKTPPNGSSGPIDLNDYNVYVVEKHADSLCFFVNDTHTFTYPRIQTDKEGQFPFADYRHYLLLDMQLGGRWVGAVASEDLPVEMHIDWVRFYESKSVK
jgi:beta-glucanase (GH16 family)